MANRAKDSKKLNEERDELPFEAMDIVKSVAIIIGVIILYFLFDSLSLRLYRHRGSRDVAGVKACYSNIRVLMGAIEMYNMDNEEHFEVLTPSTQEILVAQGYIKRKVKCPDESGEYYNQGDIALDSSVACTKHGAIED